MIKQLLPVASLLAALSIAAPAPATDPSPLTTMTFNLRYAGDRPPNAWRDRRPVAVELIRKYAPDVIGTQEGVYRQVKDLANDLPEYHWIGLGRDGGSRGEFMAVFYRQDRFEPLAYDHFWLSDTPDVIASTTWGNSNRRMVTWVKFKDLKTGEPFYFFNTHFDHRIQHAREKSAELVLQRVKELKTDLPVLLVGDFNAAAGNNQAYDTLVNSDGFVDTWETAEDRGDAIGTFGGYRPPRQNGPRIDWILARGPVKTLSTEIVTFSKDGQYPSDHYPVMSRMVVGTR